MTKPEPQAEFQASSKGLGWIVFDFDAHHLNFPVPLEEFIQACLKSVELPEEYQRCFRIVPMAKYLTTFSSDRSHMKGQDENSWLATPPSYPCIQSSDEIMNLPKFVDMTCEDLPFSTVVVEITAFKQFFT